MAYDSIVPRSAGKSRKFRGFIARLGDNTPAAALTNPKKKDLRALAPLYPRVRIGQIKATGRVGDVLPVSRPLKRKGLSSTAHKREKGFVCSSKGHLFGILGVHRRL